MPKKLQKDTPAIKEPKLTGYNTIFGEVADLLETARRTSVRATNAIMTATYWEIGRRIIEHEQTGKDRALYGTQLLKRLAADLTSKFGRGFSERNLEQMRLFYLGWPISQTVSAKSLKDQTLSDQSLIIERLRPAKAISQTLSGKFTLSDIAKCFPLP